MTERDANTGTRTVGRYTIHGEIASGGMATVHLGRATGDAGFARTVAIKQMHAHLAKDPEFVAMFVDEARLAARIHHPNVVSTLDVVALSGELFVVMEYVHGESLATLNRTVRAKGAAMPLRVAVRIACDLLAGLHAAHEAKREDGAPLGLVHRDVSPQNVLVGSDGVTRVIDFGVAKAAGRLQTTRDGQIKGKIAFMSPEQLLGEAVDRRSDVYAASAVIWEILTGERLFQGDTQGHVMKRVLLGEVEPPSRRVADLLPSLDAVVMRGLARVANDRFATALEMSRALEAAAPQASSNEVSDWMTLVSGERLAARASQVTELTAHAASAMGTQSDFVPLDPKLRLRSLDTLTSTAVAGSMSGLRPVPPPASRRRWIAPAILLSAALAVGLVVRPRPPVAVRDLSLPVESAAPLPPAPGASTAPPAPSTTAVIAASAALSASHSDTRPDPSLPRGRPIPPHRRTPSGASHPAANCDPPFVVDADGVRTYKRDCVGE